MFWQVIGDLWRVLGRILDERAYVVVRLGGRKLNPTQIVSGLEATSSFIGRRVALIDTAVSVIKKRQTDHFRPGSIGRRFEVDCCFKVG